MNQIMTYAVRHKLIDSNPVRNAERPRKTIQDKTGGKIAVLTPEQIRALLEATPDQKYRTLFLTAIMTGARPGELLGIEWQDVDFDKKQIHIRRTFNHGRFFPPKTKESVRAIDCPPTLIQELRLWKLASLPNDKDLVFANDAGEPMNYSNMVQRYFHKGLKHAKISRIRFHDLRHTYASLLLQQGENIKDIQAPLSP
ncbi:MAG: tyrosine-type recombinase/integrase [Syntrophales bacterium]